MKTNKMICKKVNMIILFYDAPILAILVSMGHVTYVSLFPELRK